ncbi:tetratricopeptide repeat protein [Leptobacterium flavescens]|uniref:Tetratricopeptide repeat protein n=1 Tax=Leptobacterium flavescens TaxID=472055 RepID=A0A6P0UIG5_9FLAO|nr:tetratricopeptide repeat protein [Leptobacterium flavescens]NER12787.1 tetratricopeptide repeat protein [Leptobacterium flavescens]
MIKKLKLVLGLLFISQAGAQSPAVTVADSLYRLGNYTKAINEYTKDPSSYARMQIARAYNAIGNYHKSMLEYEVLTEKEENLQTASYELGKLYLKTKLFDKAKETFNGLILEDNSNPQYHYQLGLSYSGLGNLEAGLRAYTNAYKIDSTHLRSIGKIGIHYLIKREKDSVLKYVDKGLDFYPKSLELINLKALAYYNDNNFEEAIPWLERLLELGNEKEYIYEKLGRSYREELKYDKALLAYEKLKEFDDTNPKPWLEMGHIYWYKKEYEKAISHIKESIELQQFSFPKEYTALARIYLEMRNKGKALEYYKLAHKEEPENFLTYYQVCFLADHYYKDSATKLRYYESFLEKYKETESPFHNYVEKRISELKAEIHLAQE